MPEKTSPRISPEVSAHTWSKIFKLRREIWKQLLYIGSVRSELPKLMKISSRTTAVMPSEVTEFIQAIKDHSVTESQFNAAVYALSELDESIMSRALRGVEGGSERIQRANELNQDLNELKSYLVSVYGEFVKLRSKNKPPAMRAEAFQQGNLGLLRAIEKYNPDRGFEFETFARQQIDKAIQGPTEKVDKEGRSDRDVKLAGSLDVSPVNAKGDSSLVTAKDKLSDPSQPGESDPSNQGLEYELMQKEDAHKFKLTQQAISELPEKFRKFWQGWLYAKQNDLTNPEFAAYLATQGVTTREGKPLAPGGLDHIFKNTKDRIVKRVEELADTEDLEVQYDTAQDVPEDFIDMGKTWQQREQAKRERKLQNAVGTLKQMDQKFLTALEYQEDNKLNDSEFVDYLNSQGITDPKGNPLTKDSADLKKNNIFNTLRMKLKTNMQETKLMKLSKQKVDLQS